MCFRDPPTHTSWLLLQKEKGSQGPRLTLRASAVGPAGRQLCWLLGVTNDLFISVWMGASPPLRGGLPVCFPPDLLLFIQKLSSEAQTLVSSLDLVSFQHPSTIQTGCCAKPVISQSRDLCIPKTQGQTDLRGDNKHQNHCCTSISLAATSHYCYSRTCLRVIRHMHKCHVMQTHG